MTNPQATITIGVDGATQARRDIDSVGGALRGMNDTSLRSLSGQIGSVSSGMGTLKATVGAALGALAGAITVGAFAGWIKGAIDATDAADDLSQKTGIAVEDLAGLELAFQKGGMEADELEGAMSKLAKQIVDGSGAFSKIGVEAKNLDGSLKTNKQMLYELADQFALMENGVQKAALAQEIFGKSGADMIPLLNGGSEGLREMDEMARKLGLSLSKEAVAKAGDFNDTLDVLMLGGQGVARQIAAELLPTLSKLAGEFLTTMTSGDRLKNTARFLAAGLKILYTAGVGIVEVFSTVGKTVGAAGAQLVSLLQGNFSQAAAIGLEWQKDIGGSWKAALATIEAAWDSSSNAAVDSMANIVRQSRSAGLSAAELAEQSKKAAKAIEDEKQAYQNLVAPIREKIAANELELSGYVKLSESQKMAIKLDVQIASGKSKLNAEHVKEARALIDKVQAQELLIDAQQRAAQWAEVEAKYDADQYAALRAGTAAIDDRIIQMQREIDLHGLTASAAIDAERAKLEAKLVAGPATYAELAALDMQIEKLGQLAELTRSKEGMDASTKAAQQAAEDWKRASVSIEQSLTDALLRGFESGKSFGRNLVDTLKNMFSTLVLRPTIQSVIAPIAAGMAGSANAATGAAGGTGSLTSLASGASNMYGMLTGGATLAGGVGTGFLGSLTAGLSGAGGLGTGIGFGAGAAATGGVTSSLGLSMGSSIASVLGPTVSGAISSGLSALAAAAPWVAGAVALYTVAKKAFGMGPKEFTGTSTLSGWINGNGGLDANNYADWEKQGGWLRSDKGGSDKQAVGGELSAGILSTYETIKTSTADYAKALGLNADMIAGRAQGLSITFGKDEAANQKAIADFFTGVADNVAREVLPSMDLFTRSGETAAQTLQRMAVNAAGVEQVLASIGIDSKVAFGAVSNVSLLARERLVDFAGGLEAFAANTAGFQQNFLTEAERNAPVLKAVTEQLAAMGLAGVDTRDEFKSVVLGLDLTSEAGAKQYGELMKMQAAFAQLYPVIEATTAAADTAAEALAQVNKGYQDQINDVLKARMSPAELRAFETKSMDSSTVGLYDNLQGLKAEDALKATNKSWQDEIDNFRKASMSAVELRAFETQGMDASTVALYDRLAAFKAEDAASAAAKAAADALAATNKGYIDQIGQVVRASMTLEQLRAEDIKGMDASTVALYDLLQAKTQERDATVALTAVNKSWQDKIDEFSKSQMNATELRALETKGMDSSTLALYDYYNALLDTKAATQAATQAAKTQGANLLSGVDSAFSALQSVVGREKALLQEVTSKHQALASALRGTLDSMNPGGQEREDRLGAQAQIRAALAIAKESGVLPDVDAIKGALSVVGKDSSALFATQQDYLRDFYSTQADIASLAGLTDKTLSVEERSIKRLDDILKNAQQQVDALKGVDYSVFSLAEAIRGWEGALGAAKADPVASSGGGIAGLYKELLGRPADSVGLAFYKDRMAEGLTLEQIRKDIAGSKERDDYLKGLRGFAVGTNYVAADMPAMIHQGERIMPAADNRELMRRLSSPGQSNSVLAAAVERLTKEIEGLKGAANRTADATEKTAGNTGQLAEQFDNATDGGNAMRADVFNVVKTKEVA